MISINKVVPHIYDYLKVAGKSSVLQTKPKELLQFKGLKLDCDKFEFVRHSADEIEKAYKEYANSPYINAYLRQQAPLSQKSNNIVSCLKQAIRESEPVTGKFYRGLSNCADEEGVRKFIFNNKGFTSVVPEYKLGFRYKQPAYNQELETWLANGGKRENSPMFPSADMYLPKENIEHCLNYGKNK